MPSRKALVGNLLLPKSFRKSSGIISAVDDINLEIPAGQCLGLIGRNGSGKSTLLKLIAGIVHPTAGTIRVNGKLSTVLDVQSGLHHRLTGRQNIFLKGAIHGLRKKEVRAKEQQIIDFSGLGSFIENPINTYSSGMIIRLGFSIAMHMDFDVLLMDEILSVGDIVFQRQCLAKIKGFLKEGKTIVLATHNLADVAAICQRVVFMKKGKIVHDGEAENVLRDYWQTCERDQNAIPRALHPFLPENVYGTDTKEINIRQVKFFNGNGQEAESFQTGTTMKVRIGFRCRKEVENPLFRVQFYRNDGLLVQGANTLRTGFRPGKLNGDGEIELCYERLNLLEGDYYVTIGIWPDEYRSSFTDIAYDCRQWSYVIRVNSHRKDGGGIAASPFSWEMVSQTGNSVSQ